MTTEAARVLCQSHPRLIIETEHGFHPPERDQEILDRINAFTPHIVLVGMGTPSQERWTERNRAKISAPVVWCLGATADFVSGQVRRPGPRWLVENHEWASRLLADPGRLWRRYLLGNTLFLFRVGLQRAGLRQHRA